MSIQRSIRRISIKNLFGRYSYTLPEQDSERDLGKIFILYGDNGSGKTTLLKLTFHLLATAEGAGHKTAIARIPFQHFEIELDNGLLIWASRNPETLIGSFTFGANTTDGSCKSVFLEADQNNSIKKKSLVSSIDDQFIEIVNWIKELGVEPYFLSDDRIVHFDKYEQLDPESHAIVTEQIITLSRWKKRFDEPEDSAGNLLQQSLRRSANWIRNKVLQASSVGEANVNALYENILHRIANTPIKSDISPDFNRDELIKRLDYLESKSKEFSRFGFSPSFKANLIRETVSDSNKTHLALIESVLTPYIQSIEARLLALSDTQELVARFLDTLNTNFFGDKALFYDLTDGFYLKAGDSTLSPEMLSSGERHLLLLFTNTITALDQPSILMVDEPELSLNIKWQRALLDSLAYCIGDNPVQYIFATHSMEILSQHIDKVVKLIPEDKDFTWHNQKPLHQLNELE